MEMERDSALDAKSRFIKALLYGPSGTGKTVAAMHLAMKITPPDKMIVYLDSGTGADSFLNHPEIMAVVRDPKRYRRLQVNAITRLEGLADVMEAGLPPFDNIGCVIGDEYSSMVEADLVQIVKKAAEKNRSKDPEVSENEDYIKSKFRGTAHALALLRQRAHVILTAHFRDDKDKADVVVKSPSFQPKMGGSIREKVSVVGYMFGEERTAKNAEPVYERYIQTWPSRTVTAKTRIGGLPPVTTIEHFIKRVVEYLDSGEPEIEDNEPVVLSGEYSPIMSNSDATESEG